MKYSKFLMCSVWFNTEDQKGNDTFFICISFILWENKLIYVFFKLEIGADHFITDACGYDITCSCFSTETVLDRFSSQNGG